MGSGLRRRSRTWSAPATRSATSATSGAGDTATGPIRAYDCSGSVSYVLHGAGLLDYSLDSTGFMKWGKGGAGHEVTIYDSKEHVFMVIGGLRWDTSYITDGDRSGPGWSEYQRPTDGFKVRHPAGL